MAAIYQIGVLACGAGPRLADGSPERESLCRGLRDLGYVENQHYTMHGRQGPPERAEEYAKELVAQRIDVIVASSTRDAAAAKKATTTIPVVFVSADAIGTGLVESFERPGGNLTGVTITGAPSLFELLGQIIPALSRVAILWNRTYSPATGATNRIQEDAEKRGLKVQRIEVEDMAAVEASLATVVRERAQAVVVTVHPMFWTEAKRLAEVALKHRIPLASSYPPIAENGGLLAQWPDFSEVFRRAAEHVDRILKGANPAEMPFIKSNKVGLYLNLNTAKQFGLIIPPALLNRADHVIQ